MAVAVSGEAFSLEAEESRQPVSNPAMRNAAAFAHYLRAGFNRSTYYANQAESEELAAWWRAYESHGREEFLEVVNCAGQLRAQSFQRRYAAWYEKFSKYLRALDVKGVTWQIENRRRQAWLRRNPEPVMNQTRQIRFCGDCNLPKWSSAMCRNELCVRCFEANFTQCRSCGATYRRGERHWHPRRGSDCQPSPTRFRFPNVLVKSGYQPANRIVPVRLPVPSGRIPETASRTILEIVNDGYPTWDRISAEALKSYVGLEWETKDGKFPARLKNKLYRGFNRRVKPEQLTEIGNVARQNLVTSDVHYVEFTRQISVKASAFKHGGSCWWNPDLRHRCIFKVNHGIAMRLFDRELTQAEYESIGTSNLHTILPKARAWVIPVEMIADPIPVADPMSASAFLLFNAYGESGQQMSSLLAAMTGKQHISRAGLYSNGMYLNGDTFVVADRRYGDDYRIGLPVDYENLKCSCMTGEPEPEFVYPYDDSGYNPEAVVEAVPAKATPTRNAYNEEEEPDDDGDRDFAERGNVRERVVNLNDFEIRFTFTDEDVEPDF